MRTGSVAFVAERTRSTDAAARTRSSHRTARPRSGRGEGLAVRVRAVRDENLRDAVVGEKPGRELGRLSGADQEDFPALQRFEDAPREQERETRDGRRLLAERRLGTDALAALQRAHEETVRHGADRARRPREAVRLADLPEDLRLAEDHRVEARGDAEEVLTVASPWPERAVRRSSASSTR